MKVLIFGCNSFSGREFIAGQASAGFPEPPEFVGVAREVSPGNIRIIRTECFRQIVLEQILSEETPDYVMNFIGTPLCQDPVEMLEINAGVTRNICMAIEKLKLPVKKIMAIGSAAEYGQPAELPLHETTRLQPVNQYGISKLLQTEYCLFFNRAHGLNTVVARPFNLLGRGMPSHLAIPSFISRIIGAQDHVEVGNLAPRRDYLHVADAVDAYWRLLTRGVPGTVYNVCSGQSVTMREILEHLMMRLNCKLDIRVADAHARAVDIFESTGVNDRLKSLGWLPRRSLQQALDEVVGGVTCTGVSP